MQQFVRGPFVVSDELAFERHGDAILLTGTIYCAAGIYIDVDEELEITGRGMDALVRRRSYSYNAALRGMGTILRYDSPHADHNRDHHVHRYDVLGGGRKGELQFIYQEEDTPTLYEVISEVERWYYDHAADTESV